FTKRHTKSELARAHESAAWRGLGPLPAVFSCGLAACGIDRPYRSRSENNRFLPSTRGKGTGPSQRRRVEDSPSTDPCWPRQLIFSSSPASFASAASTSLATLTTPASADLERQAVCLNSALHASIRRRAMLIGGGMIGSAS